MASQSPPPLPADAEVVRNIEVLAAFVAKAGAQFEQLARVNTAGDPKFGFLLADSLPGSEAARCRAFYEWKKKRLEQRVFATDGSDDLQRKICAMVDDARTPSKAHSFEIHGLEKAKPLPQADTEKKTSEAFASVVRRAEPSQADSSIIKLDHPSLHRAKGEMKPLISTALLKRKAESITGSNTLKKGAPQDKQSLTTESRKESLSAALQEQSRRESQPLQGSRDGAGSQRTKSIIVEGAQKAGICKEDPKGNLGCLSNEARAGGDIGADQRLTEAAEKHSKESHGLRLLKSALADYVKDLLKPAWKEGNMSKEAFKSIAKKVVDKVIGSLQAHQIPKSQENVDQYMAQSDTKISKLVQGYVDRLKKN